MSTNIKNSDGSLTKIADKTLQFPANTNIGTNEAIQDAPIGHIISYMGTIAPVHYLICDGSTYNISDYPKLADHFFINFGSKNYFGGDGTTTFGVPDLRGEFLRGTGTNNHADGGNGSNVGTHQGGTSIPMFDVGSNGTLISRCNTTKSLTFRNMDFGEISASSSNKYAGYNPSNVGNNNYYGEVGVRPTNTSVLYCIKAEPTYFLEVNDPGYSTSEVFTGKTDWTGKPIYRKVFNNLNIPLRQSDWTHTGIIIYDINTVIDCKYYVKNNEILLYPVAVTLNNNVIYLANYNESSRVISVLILEYTKTTD